VHPLPSIMSRVPHALRNNTGALRVVADDACAIAKLFPFQSRWKLAVIAAVASEYIQPMTRCNNLSISGRSNEEHNDAHSLASSYHSQLLCRCYNSSVCTCIRLIGFGMFFGASCAGTLDSDLGNLDPTEAKHTTFSTSHLQAHGDLLRPLDRISLLPH
jgi:hypothetical protein